MIQDATTIRQSLLEWIQSRNDDLSKAFASEDAAVISDDGTTLTLLPNNIVCDTRIKLSVPITTTTSSSTDPTTTNSATTYCEYTLGAIYLQIRNPKQSLIVYRNDCKKYGISDPIKAIDKATIVNYFLPASFLGALAVVPPEGAVTTAESTTITTADEHRVETTTTTAAIKPESSSDRRSETTSRDKSKSERSSSKHHHRDKDRHSGSKSHHRPPSTDRKRKEASQQHSVGVESATKKKKKPDLVTNEQLFEHLNVVVDKRSVASQNKKENEILATMITKALSAKGFEITNPKEQLLPYQERTSYILSNEIPVGNSSSILRANNPRKNLSRVLELYMETIHPPKPNHNKNGKPTSSSSSKSPNNNKGGSSLSGAWKSYLVGKKPIIVVPKGMTSPLTMINAHEFLCHGRFISRANMIQQQLSSAASAGGGGTTKTPLTTFTRNVPTVDSTTGTIGGGNGSSSGGAGGNSTGLLEYEIIDNPCKLGNNPKEWERIVAVIVLGQSWQFKDWMKSPIAYNNPASLFNSVFGYYIYLEGDQIPIDVQQWSVKKSQLNRDKRGLDSVTYASFWNELDEWMKVYKAEFLPQSG